MGSVLRGLNSKQLALCPSRLRAIGPKSTTMKPLLSQVRPPLADQFAVILSLSDQRTASHTLDGFRHDLMTGRGS